MIEGQAKVEGLKQAMLAMRAAFPADPEQQRRILNASLRNAAAQTILVEAKLRAFDADSSGALAESIGIRNIPRRRLLTARKAGGVYIAPIRYNTKAMALYTRFYRTGAAFKAIDGIRHGHLVEFGHATRSGGFVPARSFLWSAAQSRANAYKNQVAKSLKKKTEAAVRRKAKKR